MEYSKLEEILKKHFDELKKKNPKYAGLLEVVEKHQLINVVDYVGSAPMMLDEYAEEVKANIEECTRKMNKFSFLIPLKARYEKKIASYNKKLEEIDEYNKRKDEYYADLKKVGEQDLKQVQKRIVAIEKNEIANYIKANYENKLIKELFYASFSNNGKLSREEFTASTFLNFGPYNDRHVQMALAFVDKMARQALYKTEKKVVDAMMGVSESDEEKGLREE